VSFSSFHSIVSKCFCTVVILLSIVSAAAVAFVLFYFPFPNFISDVQIIEQEAYSHAEELSYLVYDEEVKAMEIHIRDGKKEHTLVTELPTVHAILENLEITLSTEDTINVPLDTELYPGIDIQIDRIITKEIIETEEIPFQTIEQDHWMIAHGAKQISRKGVAGIQESAYKVTYCNDEETVRTHLDTKLIKEPVDEVVFIGKAVLPDTINKEKKTIHIGNESFTYKKAVEVTATAYTCENSSSKTTFTGTTARVGAIAVDPRVIPLNSKLYIISSDGTSWVYGYATAEDTGGFIKGNRIDLYFDTRAECIEFGRKSTTVYILE